jgi:hypothetical protein
VGSVGASRASDHHGQFGERGRQASPGWHFGPEVVEAPAEVLDEGVRSHDDPGSAVPLQSPHRSKPGLEASVVGLDGVVGMDLRVMEGGREELVEHPGIDPVAVGGPLSRPDRLTPRSFAEAKEHIAGFYIINADDLDAALTWARKVVDAIKHSIEVRPFRATGRVRA